LNKIATCRGKGSADTARSLMDGGVIEGHVNVSVGGCVICPLCRTALGETQDEDEDEMMAFDTFLCSAAYSMLHRTFSRCTQQSRLPGCDGLAGWEM